MFLCGHFCYTVIFSCQLSFLNIHKLYKFNHITVLWISLYNNCCISEKSQFVSRLNHDIAVFIKFLRNFVVFLIYAMPSPLVDSSLRKENAEDRNKLVQRFPASWETGNWDSQRNSQTRQSVKSTVWSLSVCDQLGQDRYSWLFIQENMRHVQIFSAKEFNSF